MRHVVVALAAFVALVSPTAGWSKGIVTKIVIQRVDTDTVVEITERDALSRFTVWSGPGVGGWDMAKTLPQPDEAAFIVDWTEGVLSGGPHSRPTYKVTLYVDQYNPPCNKYEVLYAVDEAGAGYVYLPRWDEEFGRCNASLIFREVEGNWFRSSQAWDDVAKRVGVGH